MKLVFLYGPPAVGKLTVAKALAEKIRYKLLHNHLLVNPITEVFPFENPANRLLTREFRLRIVEEAIKSNINVITTFGIAGNDPFSHIADTVNTVESNGGKICLVQISANEETILNRVENQSRKIHGKNLSKEKLKATLKDNQDMFNKYDKKEHITVDTTNISPEEAADRITEYYKL
jgi:deoxyadenosine/deoxycytidine kinase